MEINIFYILKNEYDEIWRRLTTENKQNYKQTLEEKRLFIVEIVLVVVVV